MADYRCCLLRELGQKSIDLSLILLFSTVTALEHYCLVISLERIIAVPGGVGLDYAIVYSTVLEHTNKIKKSYRLKFLKINEKSN